MNSVVPSGNAARTIGATLSSGRVTAPQPSTRINTAAAVMSQRPRGQASRSSQAQTNTGVRKT
jgi:hypothetical protein